MKPNNVRVFNGYQDDPLILAFRDPGREEPFQVSGITGLDAEEITRKFAGTGDSGQKFYDFVLTKREIAIQMILNPQWSAGESFSDLRDRLYRIIYASRTGNIVLGFYTDDDPIAFISGFVTKNETELFTEQPAVTLTMECPDPMLRSLFPLDVIVTDFDPAEVTVTDEYSTAPHGMTFSLEFTADADSITISEEGVWSFIIEPSGGFEEDDILHCSSEANAKELYIMRGTTRIDLGDAIVPGSSWPLMFPGPNIFQIVEAEVEWKTLNHYLTYWGV